MRRSGAAVVVGGGGVTWSAGGAVAGGLYLISAATCASGRPADNGPLTAANLSPCQPAGLRPRRANIAADAPPTAAAVCRIRRKFVNRVGTARRPADDLNSGRYAPLWNLVAVSRRHLLFDRPQSSYSDGIVQTQSLHKLSIT